MTVSKIQILYLPISSSRVEHQHDGTLIDVADLSVDCYVSLCGSLSRCIPSEEIHVREYLFNCNVK